MNYYVRIYRGSLPIVEGRAKGETPVDAFVDLAKRRDVTADQVVCTDVHTLQ